MGVKMAKKDPIKFSTLKDALAFCARFDQNKVVAWMQEYHRPVITSHNDVFNEKEYWTVKAKCVLPNTLGKLKWQEMIEK